jgi:hypothetical protein
LKFRRYLKLIALTLIFFPEPFTTPLGILLLLIVLALPGHARLSKFKNLEELVRKSLASPQSRKEEPWQPAQKEMLFHELKGQAEAAQVYEHPQYSNSAWFDNRRLSENVLHHTLNNSIPQYEAATGASRTVSPAAAGTAASELPAHRLRIENLPSSFAGKKPAAVDGWKRHYYTPDEVVFHTLKSTGMNA